MRKFVLTLTILFSGMMLFALPVSTRAQDVCTKCPDGSDPKIDFECQRQKILNPKASCDVCLCAGESNPSSAEAFDLNFFGINLRLRSDAALAQILYLGFSVFLGIVAFVVVGLGIYGAVKRSNAETDDDIAAAQKIITNAVIGFIMIVVSLLVVQLVASFLGLGSINEIATLPDLISE